MKHTLTIILLVLCIHIKSQQQNDTIKWEKSARGKLQISDFKHAPDKHSEFAAMSYISRPVLWFTRKDTLYIKLVCAFIRSNSWFNQEKGDAKHNATLLLHEQGHFDITEIEIRKIKKWFFDHAGTITRKNFNQIVDKYIDELSDYVTERNNRYDKETSYSTDEKKQQEWSEDLAGELKEFEMYEDDYIVVPLRR